MSKRNGLLLICFCSVALLLVACGGSGQTGNRLGAHDSSAMDFPLVLGNTWVYSGVFYQGSNQTDVLTATYTLTESVVDVLHSDIGEYAIFQVACYREITSCPDAWQQQPGDVCASTPPDEPVYTWYVADGNTLYRQSSLELSHLAETSIKELVFPLTSDARWYLTAAMEEANPDYDLDSMLRRVVYSGPRETPAGDFKGCFEMHDVVGGTTSRLVYCPGIGIVERAGDHSGTPWGEREILMDYMFSK
jgi:hypothetical protein